jgi:integrase
VPPDERPVLTVDQVFKLIKLLPERARALVLLATFVSLRWGEAAALRRSDLDLESATVSVRLQQVELDTGKLLIVRRNHGLAPVPLPIPPR